MDKTTLNQAKIVAMCDAVLENQALILSKLNNTTLEVERERNKLLIDEKIEKVMKSFPG